MSVALGGKLVGIALTAAAIVPGLFTNDLTTPVIGVQVTTIAGAVLGTYAAIGYDDEAKPRGKLFSLAISTVILASMAAGVIPRMVGWAWVNDAVEGGFSGLSAAVIFFLLPVTIRRSKEMVQSFKWSDLLAFWKSRKGVTPPMDYGQYPPNLPPGYPGDAEQPTEEDPEK